MKYTKPEIYVVDFVSEDIADNGGVTSNGNTDEGDF